MSKEYNSKLTSELYNTEDEDKILEILEEMDDINDPYFIYPIYDKYKQKKDDVISHYLISSLREYKSDDANKILVEIALNPKTSDKDFEWVIPSLLKLSFYDKGVVKRAEKLLLSINKGDEITLLDDLVSYLKGAGVLGNHCEFLQKVFESDDFLTHTRKDLLGNLLRIDPKKYFGYYFDNYHNKIKDKKAEVIFAQEIVDWSNGIIPKFKEKIRNEGGSRAREILEKKLKSEIKKNNQKKEKVSIKYSNAEIVEEIYNLRDSINIVTLGDETIGFSLFPESGILIKQMKIVNDEDMLKSSCNDLRSFIKKVCKDVGRANKGINFDLAKKLIKNIEEDNLTKPLNQLHLFLKSKKFDIDSVLEEIQLLNGALNKVAHLSDVNVKKELITILKELKLADFYTNEEWSELHGGMLRVYRDSLDKLHSILKKSKYT